MIPSPLRVIRVLVSRLVCLPVVALGTLAILFGATIVAMASWASLRLESDNVGRPSTPPA